VEKTVYDFDYYEVSSDILKCFLYQAVTVKALCYKVKYVMCSKTLSVDRGIHSAVTSSWIIRVVKS
jgi:hypothetical protein